MQIILKYSFLGLLVLFISVSVRAQAAAPKQIEYSGTLTDVNNNLVEGVKSMKFRIYDSFSGGQQLWSETHYNVSVKSGSFRVVLGENTPIPDNMPINSYIQIEVKNGLDWEIIVPRSEITGSIYSITSSDSGSGGMCPSDMVWAGTFCIDIDRSSSRTSYSDAIEKCALRGKRLCDSDEIRTAFYNKSSLNLQNFFVSQTFVDDEFAAKRTDSAMSVLPVIYTINYTVMAYDVKYWYQARVGADYIPIDYSNPCYPNSISTPEACMTFAYFHCCL
jgi:hypothetical protein